MSEGNKADQFQRTARCGCPQGCLALVPQKAWKGHVLRRFTWILLWIMELNSYILDPVVPSLKGFRV